jgi:deoxyribodipyrimidine photo-lyase
MKINIFWFRRDLRLDDNTGLMKALKAGLPVLPLFIFDEEIISDLPSADARISFIHERLSGINDQLKKSGSSILIEKGTPASVFNKLLTSYEIDSVFTNKDYEPYAIDRDRGIMEILAKKGIRMFSFKDQVIFGESEILKSDGKPYTVFTPYSKKWLNRYREAKPELKKKLPLQNFLQVSFPFPSLKDIGFIKSPVKVKQYDLSNIRDYQKFRDFPAVDMTSHLSPHLRFGTISIRSVAEQAAEESLVFLGELIWREFFMQILFHFPHVVTGNFKPAYDGIEWRNNESEFERWCRGETGYPIVDAGMRQLNETGYIHNRVRMIAAGFLCKSLFIDWRWGEAYFAEKLIDYELSSNNGNWQWAGGTGCDAAPYFRIFNPETQQKKYDPKNEYVKRWVSDFGKPGYPEKMVDHDFARNRAIEGYKAGIRKQLKR